MFLSVIQSHKMHAMVKFRVAMHCQNFMSLNLSKE